MVDENELDEFISDELKKDITQDDKIDESVEQHLQQMGFLWDRVQKKLHDEKHCFGCKKDVDIEKTPIHVVEAGGVEKGVVAFCSVCQECYDKQQELTKGEAKNE